MVFDNVTWYNSTYAWKMSLVLNFIGQDINFTVELVIFVNPSLVYLSVRLFGKY